MSVDDAGYEPMRLRLDPRLESEIGTVSFFFFFLRSQILAATCCGVPDELSWP